MGARFDAAIDGETDMKLGSIDLPGLSANDPDTVANETRTHLVVTGTAGTGEGTFSIGRLLGSGVDSQDGPTFVSAAVEEISKVQSDVGALLALETKPGSLDTILDTQWNKVKAALDTIFKTKSAATLAADRTSAVSLRTPDEDDILDEIDDILDALASEDNFVAATAEDGGGVFDSRELGASAAVDTFGRTVWAATATLGATGSTRYGTAVRRVSNSARDKPEIDEVGAFSYATMNETVRTADILSLTGAAAYAGGTEAISGDGTTYSGTMEVQVRFKANSVSGVVKDLVDADGLPWQYNFIDVERIVLDDARLQRNAQWNNKAGTTGAVFFTADSGLLRPLSNVPNTFKGVLLGRGADAGSEANGLWSVGNTSSSTGLSGGFGVTHVADTAPSRPSGDDGAASNAILFTNTGLLTFDRVAVGSPGDDNYVAPFTETFGGASIADGKLTVKLQRWGWVDSTSDDNTRNPTYQVLVDDNDTTGAPGSEVGGNDDEYVLVTAEFDLAAMAAKGTGAATTVNGPKHIDTVIATLEAQRAELAALQALELPGTTELEQAAWEKVQNAVQYGLLFGDIPNDLSGAYDGTTADGRQEALNLIDRALDALSSQSKLLAALDPEQTGIFNRMMDTPDDPNTQGTNEYAAGDAYRYYDEVQRRFEVNQKTDGTPNGRTIGNLFGEREYKVISTLGTTNFTRFGAWRREGTRSAARRRADNAQTQQNIVSGQGGPGTFAYSPLDSALAGTNQLPGFPAGGGATYTGETVAIQNTTILTGTVRADVSWAAATATATNPALDLDVDLLPGAGDTASNESHAGFLSLTISGLASTAGDPVTLNGSASSPGNEIADIVFSNLPIYLGGGPNRGNLIVGAATTEAVTGREDSAGSTLPDGLEVTGYGEQPIAITTSWTDADGTSQSETGNVRYRFGALGMNDVTAVLDATNAAGDSIESASVKALFVGQGVDGPLGLIGTWTLRDAEVARIHADGTKVADPGVSIHGAFGAEAP